LSSIVARWSDLARSSIHSDKKGHIRMLSDFCREIRRPGESFSIRPYLYMGI